MAARPALTTTSYAILGLLAVRPHSAYDLTQQARRSLRFIWPTSESQLYAEPKRLAREGLIRVTDEQTGGRSRKTYRITPAGRRALRAWLRTTPDAPHAESELMVRTLFADEIDPESFRQVLAECRTRVEAEHDAGLELMESYRRGEGAYPERLHVNVLWWVFVSEFFRLTLDWIDFAEAEVGGWPDDGPPSVDRTTELVRDLLARRPML